MAHNNLVLRVPECWEQAAETAIMRVWKLFQLDQKSILTESDLKCWLFTELNTLNDCNEPFSVHTEVTHYSANRLPTKKYSFRDLSLLNPNNIQFNDEVRNLEIWDNRKSLSKGFVHRGKALHFELKFSRQPLNGNPVPNVDLSDLLKINNYQPKKKEPQRKFICLIGSQNQHLDIQNRIQNFLDQNVVNNTDILKVYYFDDGQLLKFTYINNWHCNAL